MHNKNLQNLCTFQTFSDKMDTARQSKQFTEHDEMKFGWWGEDYLYQQVDDVLYTMHFNFWQIFDIDPSPCIFTHLDIQEIPILTPRR